MPLSLVYRKLSVPRWCRYIGIALVIACTYNSQASSTEETLYIGNSGEPGTLDPHRYNLRLEETLLNDLFMGLTTFSARGEIVPGAATHWTVSDDGLTWTFSLRKNLRWSDGTPLTADDFVYSLRRLMNPETAASLAYFMYMLENAEAVNQGKRPVTDLGVRSEGPHTLVMQLAAPYPFLPERLLYPTAFPVPRHVINKVGTAWTKPEHWVSNGAYTLVHWQPEAHIELQHNSHFFDPVAIQRARYLPLANEQAAYNRYRNGELHAIASFPANELSSVEKNHGDSLRQSPLLSMMYLVFNTRRPPFDDVRVRAALASVIDQNLLADKVLRSGASPALTFTPELIADYQAPTVHQRQPPGDLIKRAKQLLAEAGYDAKRPLRITLRHVSGNEEKRVNLAVAGMWRQLGVQTQLQQGTMNAHFADLRQGDFDVAWAGWIGESNAEHYLGLLASDVGDVNYGAYHSAKFDQLIGQARTQADIETRNKLLQQAEAVALSESPVVPLYSLASRRLVNPRLGGWYDNPRDIHPLRYLHLAPDRPSP
ncbi:MAG: peptide ABC transporter substrate-binding protein [Pseudomonadales bacterium]